jgi:hypothetical protein
VFKTEIWKVKLPFFFANELPFYLLYSSAFMKFFFWKEEISKDEGAVDT